MSVGQIAVRYAKALFQSAKEQKSLDVVRKDMELLSETIENIPVVLQLINSPIIDSGKKSTALSEIFKSRMSSLGLDFIRLAVQNKREEYLPGMARYFVELYKEEKGIKVATISSAVAIDESSAEAIREMVKSAFKSAIELEQDIKEELIGGFVLRVEDRQLDASVKGKLARIKKELKQ